MEWKEFYARLQNIRKTTDGYDTFEEKVLALMDEYEEEIDGKKRMKNAMGLSAQEGGGVGGPK